MKNATWGELEGLKRLVVFAQANELEISILVTDRHRQNAKWIRENLQRTSHYYDVWHIGKGNFVKTY